MSEVSKYIHHFPEEVKEILNKIRNIILDEVPNAEERISYAMPAFFLNKKPLVYFAGYKNPVSYTHLDVYKRQPEMQNSREMQREGWYAILNNFHKYTENH